MVDSPSDLIMLTCSFSELFCCWCSSWIFFFCFWNCNCSPCALAVASYLRFTFCSISIFSYSMALYGLIRWHVLCSSNHALKVLAIFCVHLTAWASNALGFARHKEFLYMLWYHSMSRWTRPDLEMKNTLSCILIYWLVTWPKKNLSRVEFFLLGYIRPHIHSSLIHKYDPVNTPYFRMIQLCHDIVFSACANYNVFVSLIEPLTDSITLFDNIII